MKVFQSANPLRTIEVLVITAVAGCVRCREAFGVDGALVPGSLFSIGVILETSREML